MSLKSLVIATWLFAACSGGGGTGTTDAGGGDLPPGNGAAPTKQASGCSMDGECAPGETCASGRCLPAAREGLEYSVVVVPPSTSDRILDQFVGVEVAAGGIMDLTLTEPVEVRGIVAFTPDEPISLSSPDPALQVLEPVGGLLVATAPGLIPGTQFRSEASVQAKQKVGEDWTFVLRLLPGVSYSVTFIPSNDPARGALAQLPTFTFPAQFSKSETGFQVLIPSRADYLAASIQGVVFLDEAGTQPVHGARVSAVGQGMKGTTAVTDDQGVFRVVVPPGGGVLTLRIEPGKGSPRFPIREFTYAEGAAELTTWATPRFIVGPVPPVRDVLVQVFSVVGQSLTPVPQARVEADGIAGGGFASEFTVSGSDGVARLSLLQGVYALAVFPPVGSDFASRVSTLDLEANPDSNVYHVPLSPRARITGLVVRDDDGSPVPGAVVTLQSDRLAVFAGTALASTEATASAVSAADGTFEVRLDPGIYAMTVIPPVSTGLARFSQPEVDLNGGDARVTVRLVRGAVVRGRVLAAPSGDPISDAQVQLFFGVSNGDMAPTFANASYASSIQMVGSSSTDVDGRFSIIVPDTEGDHDGLGGSADVPSATGFGLPAVEVIPEPASS